VDLLARCFVLDLEALAAPGALEGNHGELSCGTWTWFPSLRHLFRMGIVAPLLPAVKRLLPALLFVSSSFLSPGQPGGHPKGRATGVIHHRNPPTM
jgi:hypothetical protein